EVESLIEGLGPVIFRMGCKRANASDFRSLERAEHCIFQETRAEPFALAGRGGRETGQQHDRYGMPSPSFLQSFGRVVIVNLADHQRVIADNHLTRQGHVGLRGSGLLVLESVADQKTVERFASAIEAFERVIALELLYA